MIFMSNRTILEKLLEIDKELKELYMIFNSSIYDIDKISIELDTIISAYKLSTISLFVDIGNTLANKKRNHQFIPYI